MTDDLDRAGLAIRRIAAALDIPVERFFEGPSHPHAEHDELSEAIGRFVATLDLDSPEAARRLHTLIWAEVMAARGKSRA